MVVGNILKSICGQLTSGGLPDMEDSCEYDASICLFPQVNISDSYRTHLKDRNNRRPEK
jgi:hypothetical protein